MRMKICEGCLTYRESKTTDNFISCYLRPHVHTHHWCPCIKCLIKSMCNAPCEEFGKYIDIIDKFVEKFG